MSVIRDFIKTQPLPEGACIFLDQAPSYQNIRYLDLLHQQPSSALPDAVVEVNDQALIYLLNQDKLGSLADNHHHLHDVIRNLACRADARFLGVVTPGLITIYPIEFAVTIPKPVQKLAIDDSNFAIRDFLTGAAWPGFETKGSRKARADQHWLDSLLLKLLNQAAETLRASFSTQELSDASIISLIGRALFTRFLTDRNILTVQDVQLVTANAQSLSDLYTNCETAARTCRWLDQTFNGDLLPLDPPEDYTDFFQRLGEKSHIVCDVLSNILYAAIGGQLELGWQDLRFKHIPVDVLSQVYENFYHKFLKQQAKADSVHYTPRRLAELLVDGAFSVLAAEQRHLARVLDPAAGAGIFLVLALRRLVQEHWKATGVQPNRQLIRNILNQQLCGLDLNPEALKITALSLYLAALDLDPAPQPLSDLSFDRLFGKVLYCVNDATLGTDTGHGLGSLSPALHPEYPDLLNQDVVFNNKRKFDIVIGNPPWTQIKGKLGTLLESVVRKAVAFNDLLTGPNSEKLIRYQSPDLPFLWKATQWTRPGGAIALLLDAGVLFQPESQRMRDLIFQAIRVTGILNGTALRQTKVWPTVSAQFCLLVAQNSKPAAGDSFFYLNPVVEPVFNDRGFFRIDPQDAIPVPCELVRTTPTALKTLFRGNNLDIDLVNRLNASPRLLLGNYLTELKLKMKVGYQTVKKNEPTQDASFLLGLKNLTGIKAGKYKVNKTELDDWKFYPANLHRPRIREIYCAPLLLFRKAAKLDVKERGALHCDFDLAYTESFYGISFKNTDSAEDLAAYLYVLSYSSLFVYFPLMTSSKFGVERETFHKEDYEHCPVVRWSEIKTEYQLEIEQLAVSIMQGKEPWTEVDNLIAKIYRLTQADQQLIADTMEYALPHAKQKDWATTRPDPETITTFLQTLTNLLQPFVDANLLHIRREPDINSKSFEFFSITIGTGYTDFSNVSQLNNIADILTAPLSASQIRIKLATNQWLIGQLAQRRYWSKTRARLLALEWLHNGLLAKQAD